MKALIAACLVCVLLSGCASENSQLSAAPVQAKPHLKIPMRVKVQLSEADKNAARAKALTGFEGEGWEFFPLYGTAVDSSGKDLAVCGKAQRHSAQEIAYFAFYNGELILWDQTETHGLSVENQFLTVICSHE